MIAGVDVSHHQGAIDWTQVAAAGKAFAVYKASEGTGMVDAQLAANRAGVKAAGMVGLAYHFADGGDPLAEAAHFCATVGALWPGEGVVLDWETTAADPVGWCKAWLDRVQATLGVRPLLYLNQSTMARFDWSLVIGGNYGLWLAKYDGTQTAPAVSGWGAAAMKQYTDAGGVPGIAGPTDLDVFYGDAAALRAYGASGWQPAPPPPPAPPPAPSFDVRAWRAHAGDTGQVFAHLQAWANRMFPAYASTPITPTAASYGPQTVRFLAEFCRRVGIASDGRDIGPKTAAALYAQGFRG